MSLIQNLVARLTMDSTAFDRNAKGAAQSMRSMQAGSLALQRTVAGLAVAYLSARGLVAGIKSVALASIEAETADRGVIAALRVRGQYTESNVALLDRQAEAMQQVTRYSDEEIKSQQAFALTMGAGVSEIGAMTEAAIGLSAAYGKDLHSAMKIIALARQGETGQLKEMGLVIDKTKTSQQQYYQVLNTGRSNFSRATEDAQTFGGAIAQIGNEWQEMKEELAKPFVPYIVKAMQAVKNEMTAVPKGQDTWNAIKRQPEGNQDAIWKAYRQRMQEQTQDRMPTGWTATQNDWREDPEYLKRLTAAYARSDEVQTRIKGGDGGSELPAVNAKARESLVKLNEEMSRQIEIQREAATGNLHAAETVNYRIAAEETYGKGTEKTAGAIAKQASAIELLNEMRSRQAASDYLQDLEDQTEILQLQRAGLDDQARLQEVLNDFRKQGIKLTEEETDAIAEQIDRISDLEDHYQSLGEGIQGAFAEIRDEMQTVGDLAHDVVKVGFEGIADSIAAAVVEGENLGDSLRNVGLEIASMLVKWAAMQAMSAILPGSGSLTSLVGHSGGVIGSSGFAARRDSSVNYIGVPRLHDGLKPDEFRFIGQRGEKITSKSGVASENKQLDRIASLLERRQNVSLSASIVDRRDVVTRERLESREGEQMVMYHVGRNQ